MCVGGGGGMGVLIQNAGQPYVFICLTIVWRVSRQNEFLITDIDIDIETLFNVEYD